MEQRTCAQCYAAFETQATTKRYCSVLCKRRAKQTRQVSSGTYQAKMVRRSERGRTTDRVKRYEPGSECTAEGCERTPHGNGQCRMHYKRWARANGLEHPPSDAWSDIRRDRWHRRRTLIDSSDEIVRLADVIERDGLNCAWCDQPVDLTLTWQNPMSKSLDHHVPLARGGAHTLENARLMHRRCNSSKGITVDLDAT